MPNVLNRIPVIKTYSALRDAQAKIAALREEVRKVREERDAARRAMTHILSDGRMKELVQAHADTYRTAPPFPHIVLDDVFDPRVLKPILAEFEAMDRGRWHSSDKEVERKWSTEDVQHFGAATRTFVQQLNGGPFVAFLEKLTGIKGLVADPHLRGGGLHEIRRDGALGVHADFNLYPRLNLWRRLNFLLYLNENWSEDWGGALELWDRSGTHCVKKVAPLFNRVVIFDTSNYSYHGHPAPLMCPPDRTRKSIALYYYTVEAPEGDVTPHTTIFLQAEATRT